MSLVKPPPFFITRRTHDEPAKTVRADVIRHAAPHEQIAQTFQHTPFGDLAISTEELRRPARVNMGPGLVRIILPDESPTDEPVFLHRTGALKGRGVRTKGSFGKENQFNGDVRIHDLTEEETKPLEFKVYAKLPYQKLLK